MPFFGRQGILAKTAAAAAAPAGDRGYWNQSDNPTSSNLYKSITFTGTAAFSNTSSNVDVSFWFKGSNEFDANFDGALIWSDTSNGIGDNGWGIEIHRNYGVACAQYWGNYGGETIASHQNTANNFATTYMNNAWHHCYIQWRGRANNNALSRIYLDGVDTTFSKNAGTMPGNTPHNTEQRLGHPGSKDRRNRMLRADYYQLFHSASNNIANITRFYNSGHVNLGTDGNDSGAETPEIWLYVSGGVVTNGGSKAGTVSEVGDGTLVKSNTGGPAA